MSLKDYLDDNGIDIHYSFYKKMLDDLSDLSSLSNELSGKVNTGESNIANLDNLTSELDTKLTALKQESEVADFGLQNAINTIQTKIDEHSVSIDDLNELINSVKSELLLSIQHNKELTDEQISELETTLATLTNNLNTLDSITVKKEDFEQLKAIAKSHAVTGSITGVFNEIKQISPGIYNVNIGNQPESNFPANERTHYLLIKSPAYDSTEFIAILSTGEKLYNLKYDSVTDSFTYYADVSTKEFVPREVLTNQSQLDNKLTTGIYYTKFSPNLSDEINNTNWLYIINFKRADDNVFQIALNDYHLKLFVRQCANSKWSEWKQIYPDPNVVTKSELQTAVAPLATKTELQTAINGINTDPMTEIYIHTSTITEEYKDLNNLPKNSITKYHLSAQLITELINSISELNNGVNHVPEFTVVTYSSLQQLYTYTGAMYYRIKFDTGYWGAWYKLNTSTVEQQNPTNPSLQN